IRQDLFKRYAPDCFLAVTELMLYPKDERYPDAKTIAEALWYSGFINGCMRQGDFVRIITYSASMNHGASLQKANEQIFPTPGWLAYTLYSTAEGRYPCGFELKTPFYEVPRLPKIPNTFREYSSPERAPLLDAFCMSSEDGKILNVFLSNRSLTGEFSVPVKLTGGSFRSVTVDTLSGARNMLDSNSLKNPDRISITSTRKSISMSSETVRIDLPSLSLVRLTFSR
ncbi:MAG: alpha-L-arabinofuranosidase C-terminal domain-containing protein, partial [Kiritimatiellales bacterium]